MEPTEKPKTAGRNRQRDRDGKAEMKRELGLVMATALVIGNMVASGIFLLPASLAATAGPVSIVAWLCTGIGAMLLGAGRSRRTRRGTLPFGRQSACKG
jgi:hypothetical protein